MTAIRKFLFENSFDVAPPSAKPLPEPGEGEDVQDEGEEETPPSFNEEDLNEARQTGFNAGKQEGISEAAEATDRQIADTLAVICERVVTVFDAQQKAVDDLQANGITVVQALAKKVLPEMSAREGTGEIERMARSVLDRLRTEPRIVFSVSENVRERMRTLISEQIETQGCTGVIDVIADPEMAAGDCRIEWKDGGAERNTAELLAEIGDIIERNGGPAPAAEKPAETGAPSPETTGTGENMPAPSSTEFSEPSAENGVDTVAAEDGPEKSGRDPVVGDIDG